MKLSDIKPNPRNPRLIKDWKFKKLVNSIKEFPKMLDLRPIIVDAEGIILGGNMRYKALLEIGYKEVPDTWIRKADTLTDAEKVRFIIEDNVEFGEWDTDILANEWDSELLNEWGVEVPTLDSNDYETKEDDYEIPEKIETNIKLGDIFQIGKHRLMCGDSTKIENVEKLMNGEKADMVFTDPPYGVSIGKKNKMLNSFQTCRRNLTSIVGDDSSPEELKIILTKAFKNLKLVSNDCCTYFVTAPQGGELGMMMMMMKDAGLLVRHVLIWMKNSPTFSMGRLDYDYQHEPILLTWNKKHKFYGLGEHKTSIWKIDKPRSNKEHPTMKPVKLVENALLNNSTLNDIIVDIYLGSGTTMVASHQLNRKCYGMEISPEYCQVIIDRMKKLDDTLQIVKVNE